MINDSILIINDVAGYGRVSSFAMLPVMTAYGFHPYVLPTALVSNTMDYGSSVILDTTSFMKETIEKWNDFGFRFSTITTGLINSSEQVDLIMELIDSQDSPFVLVDPIMADDGKLYPGMYKNAVECYRRLIAKAGVIVPNFTEATMIAGLFEDRKSLNEQEYDQLIDALRKYTDADIVITGCENGEGDRFNLCHSHNDTAPSFLEYEYIPVSLIGTGDVFSAALLSNILKGKTLPDSVKTASSMIIEIVKENESNPDHYDIRLEKTLLNTVKSND